MKHTSFIYFANKTNTFEAAQLVLNQKSGDFIVADFDGSANRYDTQKCEVEDLNFCQSKLKIQTGSSTEERTHQLAVKKALELIEKRELEKVVISCTKHITGQFDIKQILADLQLNFANTLVYCLRLENQMWLGATPEILIEGKESHYQTFSLAGTKKLNEKFTDKEIKEQEIVTKYVAQKLEASLNLIIEPTTELVYNNIKHLLSLIRFESKSVLKNIKELHPTPAVLGVPKDNAKAFISNNEKHKREFYTGYLGFLNPENTSIYVNLRCGQLYRNGITLYAGGGIVKDSIPEDEWIETENKVATFTAILNQHTLEGI